MALFLIFLFLLLGYAVFSYALVDPNLVLSSNEIYWNFQSYMWENFYSNGSLMAYLFFGLAAGLFVVYFFDLTKTKS